MNILFLDVIFLMKIIILFLAVIKIYIHLTQVRIEKKAYRYCFLPQQKVLKITQDGVCV